MRLDAKSTTSAVKTVINCSDYYSIRKGVIRRFFNCRLHARKELFGKLQYFVILIPRLFMRMQAYVFSDVDKNRLGKLVLAI